MKLFCLQLGQSFIFVQKTQISLQEQLFIKTSRHSVLVSFRVKKGEDLTGPLQVWLYNFCSG